MSDSLTPDDIARHTRLGIPVAMLIDHRVQRLDDEDARRAFPSRVPGDLSGVRYPYVDPETGAIVTSRLRRDHPEIENGRPKNKYLSPFGDVRHLYFPVGAARWLADPSVPAVIVEAEKSVLAITAASERAGRPVLVIGTGGCWGWRGRIGKTTDATGARVDEQGPLPDFGRVTWTARDTIIVFDGNVAINPAVREARRACAVELRRRGARVRLGSVPTDDPAINGPDDLIAERGDAALWRVLDAGAMVPSDLPLTDSGNAEYFADLVAGELAYDHTAREWVIFTGHHWTADPVRHVTERAVEAMRRRATDAIRMTDPGARKDAMRWASRSEDHRQLVNLLTLAQSKPGLAVTHTVWDAHPLVLGVHNGVVDLDTQRFRPGRPADYVSKVMPVMFDPAARCPRFEQFMREIFADETRGDGADLAAYLQRVFGYCLTGLTTEQVFWILWGLGANGKSTLLERLLTLFGPYGWTMPFPTATWTSTISEYQRAELPGRRLISASEVTQRGHLNEDFIKSLTGGDTVNARRIYSRPFTFEPVGKFLLRCNDKPVIRDLTHSMWRRVKLIPFTRTFAVDKTLAPTLLGEASGILNWLIEGCRQWQIHGLAEPSVVTEATASYRDASDVLKEFVEACCLVHTGVSIRGQRLYAAYQAWERTRGMSADHQLSLRTFGERVKQQFADIGGGRHAIYSGITLLSAEDEAPPE